MTGDRVGRTRERVGRRRRRDRNFDFRDVEGVDEAHMNQSLYGEKKKENQAAALSILRSFFQVRIWDV